MSSAFSTSDAMQYGFAKFGEESAYIVSLVGAVEAVSLVSSVVLSFQFCWLSQLLTQLDSTPPDTFWYAFIPTYFVVRIAGQVLVNKALLMLHDGRKISWDEILGFDFGYHFPLIVRMVAATIAYSLWATLLTLMLVLPGLFATSTLRFFKFTIVDHDADAVEGLRESYEIGGESKTDLVSLNVLTSAMRGVGLLCLGVGFVPASAICGLAEAYAYKRLAQAYQYQQEHLGTQQL